MVQKDKITVVFGINDFLVGGAQRQFIEQLRLYNRDRLDIVLITLFEFPGAATLYKELPEDLPVYRLAFSSLRDLPRWREVYRLLRRLQPDIVVSSLFSANTVFRVLQPLVGYISIAREHNTYVHKPLWQRIVDRLLAERSRYIVTVSAAVADFTARQEDIARKKFIIIHNGIDAEAFRRRIAALPSKKELRQEFGISLEGRMFVSIARLIPQKGHRTLIEGFMLFRKQNPNSVLCIVGDGPLKEDLIRFVLAEDGGEYIRFFGHRDDVDRFYKAADAYVSASHIEGLSNAMLEALAAGLPLIATRTGGTDELIREGMNGFFVDGVSAGAISDALTRYSAADAAVLAHNARTAAGRFDIHATVDAYEELFASVAAKRFEVNI